MTVPCSRAISTIRSLAGRLAVSVNSVFNPGAVFLADGEQSCFAALKTAPAYRTCARHVRRMESTDGASSRANADGKSPPIPRRNLGNRRSTHHLCSGTRGICIAYTSFARGGPGVSLALTNDFRSFKRFGVIMPPEDKDAALLPRRINGYWALIHRPMTALGAHMWISYSPDLQHWGSHKVILEARRGGWWDANKIGLCSPPIETPKGWLMIYHGVRCQQISY